MDRAHLDRRFGADGDVDAAAALVYRAAWWRGVRTTREAAPVPRAATGSAQHVNGAAVPPPTGGRPVRNDREGAHA